MYKSEVSMLECFALKMGSRGWGSATMSYKMSIRGANKSKEDGGRVMVS